ncbi:glycoside hydrolase family 99-like domain-containing protein [Mycetocola sp. 2940]|uniref:glycoside hydrolase family 99-like domain-containing protein n=1 Tax=Mycetocola sp. 2940 TaxID=3156452 RepID=UPI003395C431
MHTDATSAVQIRPSEYSQWLSRRIERMNGGYPTTWTSAMRERTVSTSRVAVVLHVFYPELVPELLDGLARIPVDFDLLVTNASGEDLDLQLGGLERLQGVRVLPVANKGRDILPLIYVVNAGLLDGYDLVLKIHTKRSEWREDHAELGGSGDGWRESLLRDVLGAAPEILSAFADDPTLGLVTAPGNILGSEFWGGDRDITRDLLRRIQLPLVDEDLRFPSGSIYWVRAFILQGLRSLELSAADFEDESGQVDGTTAHGVERLIGIVTTESGYVMRETGAADSASSWERFAPGYPRHPRARAVPFYLPQFHVVPENDAWWGKGFTEWSNVAAAKPVFSGHVQPLLPGELGFYDLANPDVRSRQYTMAQDAGIEGFMYYYYWFAGKKLLNKPIEDLLASDSDHPFCVMWANENWTRTWDGSARDVLMAQDYEHVPTSQFIDDVLPLLLDDRYIRIDSRPVLAVYKIAQIPDYRSVLAQWRETAREHGLDDLYILSVDVGAVMDGVSGTPADHGFDGYMEFAPHNLQWDLQPRQDLPIDARFQGDVLSYGALAKVAEHRLRGQIDADRFPGVMVSFDNTARRQWTPHIWYGSNPYTFRRWLEAAVAAVADRPRDQRVVFINAWNEWAESAVLEPTQRYGQTYLHAVRDVLLS